MSRVGWRLYRRRFSQLKGLHLPSTKKGQNTAPLLVANCWRPARLAARVIPRATREERQAGAGRRRRRAPAAGCAFRSAFTGTCGTRISLTVYRYDRYTVISRRKKYLNYRYSGNSGNIWRIPAKCRLIFQNVPVVSYSKIFFFHLHFLLF